MKIFLMYLDKEVRISHPLSSVIYQIPSVYLLIISMLSLTSPSDEICKLIFPFSLVD